MPNGPFDRLIINPREKPLSSDINQAESQLDRSLRFFAEQLMSNSDGDLNDAFVNSGLKVVEDSPVGLSVVVSRGIGFQNRPTEVASAINAIAGLDDLQTYKPIPLLSDHTFTVPTAPTAPNTRIDIIEVQAQFLVTDPQTRQVLNTGTGEFAPATIDKILTWLLDGRIETVVSPVNGTQPLVYKQGVAANPGLAPAVTTGYIKVAEIAVGSDVTTISQASITDFRSKKGLAPDSRTVRYPTTHGYNVVGTSTKNASGFVTAVAATDIWVVPLSGVQSDELITEVRIYVNKALGAGTIDARLFENNSALAFLQTNFASSLVTAGAQTITISEAQNNTIALPYAMREGGALHVQVDFTDIGDDLVGIELDLQKV